MASGATALVAAVARRGGGEAMPTLKTSDASRWTGPSGSGDLNNVAAWTRGHPGHLGIPIPIPTSGVLKFEYVKKPESFTDAAGAWTDGARRLRGVEAKAIAARLRRRDAGPRSFGYVAGSEADAVVAFRRAMCGDSTRVRSMTRTMTCASAGRSRRRWRDPRDVAWSWRWRRGTLRGRGRELVAGRGESARGRAGGGVRAGRGVAGSGRRRPASPRSSGPERRRSARRGDARRGWSAPRRRRRRRRRDGEGGGEGCERGGEGGGEGGERGGEGGRRRRKPPRRTRRRRRPPRTPTTRR